MARIAQKKIDQLKSAWVVTHLRPNMAGRSLGPVNLPELVPLRGEPLTGGAMAMENSDGDKRLDTFWVILWAHDEDLISEIWGSPDALPLERQSMYEGVLSNLHVLIQNDKVLGVSVPRGEPQEIRRYVERLLAKQGLPSLSRLSD